VFDGPSRRRLESGAQEQGYGMYRAITGVRYHARNIRKHLFGLEAMGEGRIPNFEAHSSENTLVKRTQRGLVRRADAGKREISRRGRGIFGLLEQRIVVERHLSGTLAAPSLSPVPSSRLLASNTSWVTSLVWDLVCLPNAPVNSYCNPVARATSINKSTT
jgi:hypothetical protein